MGADVLCPFCGAVMFHASLTIARTGLWHHYACPRRCCNLELPLTEAEAEAYWAEQERKRRADAVEGATPLWRRLFGWAG